MGWSALNLILFLVNAYFAGNNLEKGNYKRMFVNVAYAGIFFVLLILRVVDLKIFGNINNHIFN